MIRLDPLTQSVSILLPTTSPKISQTQHLPERVAPAEQIVRFVSAVDRTNDISAYEAGYTQVVLRRRMKGRIFNLSDLGARLADADLGIRATDEIVRSQEGCSCGDSDKEQTRMLHGAAVSLSAKINLACAEIANVQSQIENELNCTVCNQKEADYLTPTCSVAEKAAIKTLRRGEALICQAQAINAQMRSYLPAATGHIFDCSRDID